MLAFLFNPYVLSATGGAWLWNKFTGDPETSGERIGGRMIWAIAIVGAVGVAAWFKWGRK